MAPPDGRLSERAEPQDVDSHKGRLLGGYRWAPTRSASDTPARSRLVPTSNHGNQEILVAHDPAIAVRLSRRSVELTVPSPLSVIATL